MAPRYVEAEPEPFWGVWKYSALTSWWWVITQGSTAEETVTLTLILTPEEVNYLGLIEGLLKLTLPLACWLRMRIIHSRGES